MLTVSSSRTIITSHFPLSNSYTPLHGSLKSQFLFPNRPIHQKFNYRRRGTIHISFSANNSRDDNKINHSSVSGGDQSVKDATWVAVATLTNKILGLLREASVASAFGLGPVATAFKYAWVLPGFASSLLGGLNGPIHIIMATTLSKLSEERGKRLFQHMTVIMFLVGSLSGAFVYAFPELVVRIYAPGLWILAEGQIIRELAIEQLKLMTPCIVLAGPVGLGFGYMRRK